MKVICEQRDFLEALNIVGRAITPNTTLPVLNNILIKAEGKNLLFSATNLEIAIRYFISCEVRNEGSITVPAKLLMSYISLLPEGKLEISTEEGLQFAVKSKNSQTKMKGVHADEFPVIPEVEKGVSFQIPVKQLQVAVDQVAFAASQNPSRPVLAGVLFVTEKDVLKFVSTDSYRLAERKIHLPAPVETDISCIVPARTTSELGKLVSKANIDFVETQMSKNQVLFRIGDIELISRLIEGKFPDYERIIPKASKTKIEVSNSDLSQVVRRVSLFARENNNSIKISVTNDGKMNISTDETKIGEDKADLDITLQGENNKVALNAQYLLDVLATLHEEKLYLEFNDKVSPIVVRPCKSQDYVYIIMPLKV